MALASQQKLVCSRGFQKKENAHEVQSAPQPRIDDYFCRIVQSSGRVPIFPVAAQLGAVATTCHEAALAIAALARLGECGNRRLRVAISKLPVVPISQESSRGSLLDVLPLHPDLVERWVGWRIGTVSSAHVEVVSSQVRSMADALNVLFCAGVGDKYVLPATVRELTSRQLTMLEFLWQVANEFF